MGLCGRGKMGNKIWMKLVLVLFGLTCCPDRNAAQEERENGLIRSKRAACGGHLKSSAGTFSLPTEDCANGTLKCYRKDFKCSWKIQAPKGHVIMLKSAHFSLEPSENCIWDYCEMVESDDQTGTRYCGWKPLTYISYSNKLTVNFKSDDTYEATGFTFEYSTYAPDVASHCNTSIIGGPDGKIYNVEESDSSCFYSIEAPKGMAVELTLKMIDFGSNDCFEESLKVRNGSTSQGDVIQKWCSRNAISGEVLQTNLRRVFIEYHNVIGSEGERFMMEYKYVAYVPEKPLPPSEVGGDPDCSGMYRGIFGESGVLIYTTPSYMSMKHCIIVVRNNMLENGVVQVKFEEFYLEESKGCVFDNVTVQSGERKDSQMLGGPYCGQDLEGRTFVTYGNSLRLEYKTDESLSFFGFRAQISIVPEGKCGKCWNGVCVKQGYENVCMKGRPCRQDSCENGGTCVTTKTSSLCYCPSGFIGKSCSEPQGGGAGIRFTRAPKSRRVAKGTDLYPVCVVPNAYDYVWFLNGEMIGEYNSKTRFGTHPSGVLQIDDISAAQEGSYTCVARTNNGNAEHTFDITVTEDCDVEFTERPLLYPRRVGDNILVTCAAKNAEKIHWWKGELGKVPMDFTKLDVGPGSKFKQQHYTNYLVIENAQVEDEGIYRCVAEDARGCTSHREATLKVLNVKQNNKFCGISKYDEHHFGSRIVRGQTARWGENPWHVMIRTDFENERRQVTFCGGSIISTKYVITAAHCVEEFRTASYNKKQVPFSESSVQLLFNSSSCRIAFETRRPKNVFVHPEFNITARLDSDIAIIELDQPLEFGINIRPICIETPKNIEAMFFNSRSEFGRVAGCGIRIPDNDLSLSKKLQTVQLPFVHYEECKELVEDWNMDQSKNHSRISITENMICAGFKNVGRSDTCQGDSGGAYIMESGGQWFQVGIVSWGITPCTKTNMPGFYTDIANFYNWIEEKTHFNSEVCVDCDWALQ